MQIDSSFAEADVGNIREGQPVHFTVDAFPDRGFSGTVRQVRLNPTTQSNVVTYDVVVAVENPDKTLLPGMTAYVTIVTAAHRDVLRAPNAALRFRPEENKGKEARGGRRGNVYTIANGQLRAVPVTVLLSDNRYTEIESSSLRAGDQVVVEDNRQGAADSRSGSRFRMRLF